MYTLEPINGFYKEEYYVYDTEGVRIGYIVLQDFTIKANPNDNSMPDWLIYLYKQDVGNAQKNVFDSEAQKRKFLNKACNKLAKHYGHALYKIKGS